MEHSLSDIDKQMTRDPRWVLAVGEVMPSSGLVWPAYSCRWISLFNNYNVITVGHDTHSVIPWVTLTQHVSKPVPGISKSMFHLQMVSGIVTSTVKLVPGIGALHV